MGRVVVTVVVVLAEMGGLLPGWAAPLYGALVAVVMVVGWRWPLAGFLVAVALGCLPGGADLVLLWAAYRAGSRVASRRGAVLMTGGALGYLTARLLIDAPAIAIPKLLVLLVLPLVVGLYLAQLRNERELLAERERLRERLRIAREVHDSLGHRLSLVSVQAAALKVSELPDAQHEAVRQLAGTARQAMDELHELVGTLRRPEETDAPGLQELDELAAGFRAAGLPVTLRRHGDPRPLPASVGQTAYRVVEESLTNAAKHAPHQQVVASVDWEEDALLLTIANDLPDQPAEAAEPGHGLTGLAERVRMAGGLLRTARTAAQFQLVAMLPLTEVPSAEGGRLRWLTVGLAAAVLALMAVPMVGMR